MRSTCAILFLALMSLGTVRPAAAQGVGQLSATNLRDACENLVLAVRGIRAISQEDPGAMLCLGFLAGWIQAMNEVPDKTYCFPETVSILPGDLADLVVTYVDGHPDRGSAQAHTILLDTFTEAFPCVEDEPEETGDHP